MCNSEVTSCIDLGNEIGVVKRSLNKERGKTKIYPPILVWNQRYFHKPTVTHTDTEM